MIMKFFAAFAVSALLASTGWSQDPTKVVIWTGTSSNANE